MLLKSDIERAFILQQEKIRQRSEGHPRSSLANISLSGPFILVISGVRRCGKSTLIRQLMRSLDHEYAFFNFEDPKISGFDANDFSKFSELTADHTHYFLDEVQNVKGWELFVRSLHDDEKVICVTGSNASLLSRELGTHLTGRYLPHELFPFSYQEFLSFRELEADPASFQRYMTEGGFPEFLKQQNPEILYQLLRDVAYRDIVVRHGIRNSEAFIEIVLHLISNASKLYSLNKIKNTYSLGSVNSVANYVGWLEDSYMVFTLPKFSWSPKASQVNPKKIYVIDTAFAQANSLSFSSDEGRLFENAVYLHLRRNNKSMYYFREKFACDFVIKNGTTVTEAIQVCTELNIDNKDRELNGLEEALAFFDLKTGTIVTYDQQDVLEINGRKVYVVPAWKYFLE